MGIIGFSTGAVAKSDYSTALAELRKHRVHAVELSALRFSELYPLVHALPGLELADFQAVSFHAPSRFDSSQESFVVQALRDVADLKIPIVIHPDVIYCSERWIPFRDCLLIENMDKRKPIGRTADELSMVFAELPEARLCLDIGHARQVDATMLEARKILERFGERLAQIHLSEVNSGSRHDPRSSKAGDPDHRTG